MLKPKPKLCIVGYGKMGRWQHDASASLFEIISIYDVNPDIVHENIRRGCSLKDAIGEADAVIVTSPAYTHFEICETCLMMKKHVFVESSLSDKPSNVRRLYDLAKANNCLLYISLFKRMDPNWRKLSVKMNGEYPLFASVSCKEADFPKASHFQTCGSIFRDLSMYDIDMLCVLLQDFPTKVFATTDAGHETASITLYFSNGCNARTLHSRHSRCYEEKASFTLEKREAELDKRDAHFTLHSRFRSAAKSQMQDFRNRMEMQSFPPNVTLDHYLMLERIVYACELSSFTKEFVTVVSPSEMCSLQEKRRYTAYQARKFQTIQHVRNMRVSMHPKKITLTVWEALVLLKAFEDASHPLFSMYHYTLQLAETMRNASMPEWMQVTAILHKLGLIMHIWGSDEDGTSMASQWSLTGQTFIVGYPIPESVEYPELNVFQNDNPQFMTHSPPQVLPVRPCGIYAPRCGIDSCLVSYSQDEYIHSVVQGSKTLLPPEALKILRYSSLSLWFLSEDYEKLESNEDRLHKGWMRMFDVYAKMCKETVKDIDYEAVQATFSDLVEKFVPSSTLHF